MNDKQLAGDSELDPSARRRVLDALQQRGVIVPDPDRTYVGEEVVVASGTILYPGTHLRGATNIGPDCRIGPDSWVEDTTIEGRCTVRYSVLESAHVRPDSRIGPYAHLRPGADVGPEARIGNFVEVKQARLGRGVKAGHLAYIGDADVGEGTNVGAGAITCNYDGDAKHRTVIEKDVFVGSNASLVAPVTIGEGAVVAAGSTITEDVPAGGLAFGRARQVTKRLERKTEEDPKDDR
jgi:bifunctional UDP-N-acetylglucosamine pyrophosphorylase/glucosamine-1-phosphate N-acetyltransferase